MIDTIALTQDQLERFDEMAGKYQFDGGYSREDSERRAYEQLFGIANRQDEEAPDD